MVLVTRKGAHAERHPCLSSAVPTASVSLSSGWNQRRPRRPLRAAPTPSPESDAGGSDGAGGAQPPFVRRTASGVASGASCCARATRSGRSRTRCSGSFTIRSGKPRSPRSHTFTRRTSISPLYDQRLPWQFTRRALTVGRRRRLRLRRQALPSGRQLSRHDPRSRTHGTPFDGENGTGPRDRFPRT